MPTKVGTQTVILFELLPLCAPARPAIRGRLLAYTVEALSRQIRRTSLDRDEKLPYYAQHGVRHAWLLDPIDKCLEVYSLNAETKRWREVRIYQGDTVIRAEPFEAVELDLGALWSPPRPA